MKNKYTFETILRDINVVPDYNDTSIFTVNSKNLECAIKAVKKRTKESILNVSFKNMILHVHHNDLQFMDYNNDILYSRRKNFKQLPSFPKHF